MGINRGGAGLQPDARRLPRLGDCIAYVSCRFHARVLNEFSVRGRVATVHALAGEIDNRVSTFKFPYPIAQRFAVPRDRSPGCLGWFAAEHDNFMCAFV